MPTETTPDRIAVHGIEVEVLRCGAGAPVLFLHGFQPAAPDARFLELLGRRLQVIAPSHPGFGNTPRPKDFESVYDLLHLYTQLIEALGHPRISLIGASFGGWLAAELALRMPSRIGRLVLVDALGIKVSDRETPDILDIFNVHPDTVRAATWHDPRNAPDYDAMEDAELIALHRSREALSLYGWHPYMHHPRLAYWLPAIKAPTQVLWGASDGIVKPGYGQAMARLILGARYAEIAAAGHHPEIEQPDAFADHVIGFLAR
ncbi:alpha/beta hydrolase [Siccirubricoccus sp. KC 17139]|uniref:Alpha/beta hydrolase n=1 Tax=Siccirubricoccus soli TaxID=2899147 RepID=A0ABT1D7Q2_9PROT|nr:alpha/beta hydrolase [Siccirubricoccus soli]MCO6417973.1 alpha/beta hydrolase [Siccirubricoccus soli]MCP2684108.1 alpha/beta hydrolase [Siccirubricoccus soli]